MIRGGRGAVLHLQVFLSDLIKHFILNLFETIVEEMHFMETD